MERISDKRIVILALLFIVAIVAYVLTMKSHTVELIETTSENDTTRIYVQIPKIMNTTNTGFENDFNSHIQQIVSGIIQDVKTSAQEAFKDGILRTKYEVHISTELKYTSKDFVSLVIYYYTYTGGAHGNTIVSTYNVDLKRGKVLSLDDIFDNACNYKDIIRKEIVNQINLQKDNYFEDAVEYVQKDTLSQRPFTITKDALQIYYQDYEIAPHSTGMPIFEIPFSKLETCLRYKFH